MIMRDMVVQQLTLSATDKNDMSSNSNAAKLPWIGPWARLSTFNHSVVACLSYKSLRIKALAKWAKVMNVVDF